MDTLADANAREMDSFRDEVRAWIQENFPASLREKLEEYYGTLPRYPEGADWKLWKDRVVAKGWGTPGWPVEYGGGGLSTEQEIPHHGRGRNAFGHGQTQCPM